MVRGYRLVIHERDNDWPILMRVDESKLEIFKVWLNNSEYSGCTSMWEFDTIRNGLVVVIDCDSSEGRREILNWWESRINQMV